MIGNNIKKVSIKYYGKSLELPFSSNQIIQHYLNIIKEQLKKDMLKVDNLFMMQQIHSAKVHVVKELESPSVIKSTDALVSSGHNAVLGVLHADCLPVLLCDTKNEIIAAIHAGWRGAKNGIIENTINTMLNIGAEINNIEAHLGPCIKENCYDVDLLFYEAFILDNKENKKYFRFNEQTQKYKFNLTEYVIFLLEKKHIKTINDCKINTYDNKEFFSYRFSNQNNIPKGLNLSVISYQ